MKIKIKISFMKLDDFILKSIQTNTFIFIVIFTTFQPMCTSAFFQCFMSNSGTYKELWTEPFI